MGCYPSIKFAGNLLYTWVERGTVRVKCLAQEHNTMSPARAPTQTARSGDERTNHEASTPPLSKGFTHAGWSLMDLMDLWIYGSSPLSWGTNVFLFPYLRKKGYIFMPTPSHLHLAFLLFRAPLVQPHFLLLCLSVGIILVAFVWEPLDQPHLLMLCSVTRIFLPFSGVRADGVWFIYFSYCYILQGHDSFNKSLRSH